MDNSARKGGTVQWRTSERHLANGDGGEPGTRASGIVHPWVGQIRLKRNGFKTLFKSYVGRASPGTRLRSRRPRLTLVSCLTASGPLARMP
eukprot:scaffold90227_cov72-Phaeocystis_antarctica.AAC.1